MMSSNLTLNDVISDNGICDRKKFSFNGATFEIEDDKANDVSDVSQTKASSVDEHGSQLNNPGFLCRQRGIAGKIKDRKRWIAALGVLVVIGVTALIYILYRENKPTSCTQEKITEIYGHMFYSDEEMQEMEKQMGQLHNSLPNNVLSPYNISDGQTTGHEEEYNVTFPVGPLGDAHDFCRGKPLYYHGCCLTCVTMVTPTKGTNRAGRMFDILQFPGQHQAYIKDTCRSVAECSGCTCQSLPYEWRAVVPKDHVNIMDIHDGSDLNNVKIETLVVDGICKCINYYRP